MIGMFFFLTQFLQDVLGYSPAGDRLRLPAADRRRCSSPRRLSAPVLVERFGPSAADGRSASPLSIVGPALAEPAARQTSGYLSVARSAGAGRARQRDGVRAADRAPRCTASSPSTPARASGLVNVSQQVGATSGLAVLVTVFGSGEAGRLRASPMCSSPVGAGEVSRSWRERGAAFLGRVPSCSWRAAVVDRCSSGTAKARNRPERSLELEREGVLGTFVTEDGAGRRGDPGVRVADPEAQASGQ